MIKDDRTAKRKKRPQGVLKVLGLQPGEVYIKMRKLPDGTRVRILWTVEQRKNHLTSYTKLIEETKLIEKIKNT